MTENQNPLPEDEQDAEVEFDRGLKLTEEYKELLKQLLRKAYRNDEGKKNIIHVKDEFTEGKSGARSFLVRYNKQPQVVAKIDHPYHLKKEETAYRSFLHNVVPDQYRVTLQTNLIESDDGESGLIIYNYLRENGDSIDDSDLLKYYRKNQKGKEVARYLERLHANTMPFRQETAHQSYPYDLEYDRLMPVHFELQYMGKRSSDRSSGTPIVLRSSKIDWSQIHAIKTGQEILLEDFEVIEKRDQLLRIRGDSPRDERSTYLRAKLLGVEYDQYQLGDITKLNHICAKVVRTREELLQIDADVADVFFSEDKRFFTVDNKKYSNPIQSVQTYLGENQREAHYSTIHGDLNLRNIMIAADSVWLIDFADTRVGPTLLDYQRLEDHVIGEILAPTIQEAGMSANALVDLLNALHKNLDAPELPRHLKKLREPYYILQKIRQLARKYLEPDDDWTEYYRGLFLVFMGALKYDTRDSFARTLSLVGTATAKHYVEQKAIYTPSAEGEKMPMSRTALLITAATIFVLGIIVKDLPWTLFSISSLSYPFSRWQSTIIDSVSSLNPIGINNFSTLQSVRDNGYLKCGVSGQLPRFSIKEVSTNADNEFIKQADLDRGFYANATGLDTDFCRAVAIAIFGQYKDSVAFVNLVTNKDSEDSDALDRFEAVINGEVHVAFRNTTLTTVREELVDFGPPIYIDTMKFMFRPDVLEEDKEVIAKLYDNLKTADAAATYVKNKLESSAGTKHICVLDGTTTKQALLTRYGFKESYLLTKDPDGNNLTNDTIVEEIQKRRCQVMASDESQLRGHILAENDIEESRYKIFPTDEMMTFEPLAPYVAEGDGEWLDIVNRVVWTTMQADLMKLHKIDSKNDADPDFQRAWETILNPNASNNDLMDTVRRLAQNSQFYSTDEYWLFLELGEKLSETDLERDLKFRFAYHIISQIGSYTDIFERNMKESPTGRNKVYNPFLPNDPENTGLLIVPPLGVPLSATK